jgi:hypothetical protein
MCQMAEGRKGQGNMCVCVSVCACVCECVCMRVCVCVCVCVYNNVLFFFFNETGVSTQDFALVLYYLSHVPCPFCSGYFRNGGLTNYLPRLALNLDPPDLSLLSS